VRELRRFLRPDLSTAARASSVLLLLTTALPACDKGLVDASDQEREPTDPATELLAAPDFEYAGAFRLPAGEFGASSLNFAEGPIDVAGSSLLIVGHSHHQAIAEFTIPALVQSQTLADLNMAGPPRQPFSTVLDRVANPQGLDRITALRRIAAPTGTQLIVNAVEYYDAPADNTHTTLVLRQPTNMSTTPIGGFYALEGAAHASGWMTDIPAQWQADLGGSMIAGQSSGLPIIGRLSVGPTAFVFDPSTLVGQADPPNPLPTEPLLDYGLDRPLHTDLFNESGSNTLWTHLSRAVFGFIVPGTRSYVVLGHSGGHGPGGICYKCVPVGETAACGGYCAVDPADGSLFYWLYDVDDFVRVRASTPQPHEVQPYAHGSFASPFSAGQMGGGSYDADSGLLYLSMLRADTAQGQYANPPVIVAFRVGS